MLFSARVKKSIVSPRHGCNRVLHGANTARIEIWLEIATLLLVSGLAFVAQAKGRNPAWARLGLLGVAGAIVVLARPKARSDPDLERVRADPRARKILGLP
jgi:hypothetical protein